MVFSTPRVERWSEFRIAHSPMSPGGFRMLLVLGPPGAGKTTLAQNILLRRFMAWHDRKDAWLDDVNPFSDDLYKALALMSKYTVVSPHELYEVLITQPAVVPTIVADEVALWSRDAVSMFVREDEPISVARAKATDFLRQVIVNIRSLTTMFIMCAQDINLVPAPLRYPADYIIDVDGFKILRNDEYFVFGEVSGSIKRRYLHAARSTITERTYFTEVYFRLPVWRPKLTIMKDLSSKRKRFIDFMTGGRVKALSPYGLMRARKFASEFHVLAKPIDCYTVYLKHTLNTAFLIAWLKKTQQVIEKVRRPLFDYEIVCRKDVLEMYKMCCYEYLSKILIQQLLL
ncbi:MAG: hypothetical protein QXT13_07370 [Pyrobaculum sp.]